jgi:hypothetical protein
MEQRVRPAISLDLTGGVALTNARGEWVFDPRIRMEWQATGQLALLSSYARSHQFTHSLRNHESVIGAVFPTELYVLADGRRIPVASGDQFVLGAAYAPWVGAGVTVQAYVRNLKDVLETAPFASAPFATGRFARMDAAVRGVAVEASFQSAGYSALASYTWQRTRSLIGDSSFVPQHAAAHSMQAGVIAFPTPTWALKLGGTAVLGRRATPFAGALEWESCNLLDQGCEFAGDPIQDYASLGEQRLPWYGRLDVGARKHWHFGIRGRQASVAVFGTFTNIVGRRNVLAYGRADGTTTPIGMRPRSVLLAGLDWSW